MRLNDQLDSELTYLICMYLLVVSVVVLIEEKEVSSPIEASTKIVRAGVE